MILQNTKARHSNNMKHFSAKKALCILLVLALSGCTFESREIHEPIERPDKITFAWWGSEMRSDYTMEGIEIFEKDNDNISIRPYSNEFTGYKENLDALMMSGNEYDVLQINSAWLDEYSPDGEGFYDLNELSDTIRLSNFSEAELEYGTRNGKLNAIPISLNAMTFYYNERILADNGLTVPKTWDDLFACADVLEPTGVLLFDASQKNQWITLVAHEEQITGKKAFGEFDAENVKSMFEFEAQLINEGVFSREDNNKEKFLDKKSAGVIRWVSDAQFYVVPLEDRGGTVTVGDYICEPDCKRLGWYVKPTCLYAISRSVKHPEQAAKLVDFLLNSEKMARLQGTEKGVPLSKSALETLDVSNMLTGVSYEASMKITDRQDMELMAPELEDTARIEDFFRLFDLWYYGQTELDEAAETFVADYPFS